MLNTSMQYYGLIQLFVEVNKVCIIMYTNNAHCSPFFLAVTLKRSSDFSSLASQN